MSLLEGAGLGARLELILVMGIMVTVTSVNCDDGRPLDCEISVVE